MSNIVYGMVYGDLDGDDIFISGIRRVEDGRLKVILHHRVPWLCW